MPERFKHYCPLPEDTKEEVWKKGIIVFDTNIFLNIYRLRAKDRDRLLQILNDPKIRDRLFVPHQVAEEFFRNRLAVIADQITTAKKFLSAADAGFNDVFKKMDQAIRIHHPLIVREDWKKKLNDQLQSLKEEYESTKNDYSVSLTSDPILDQIRELMDSRIGASFTEAELAEVHKEAESRIKNKIPPGYKDEQKNGHQSDGDFLLWKQILVEIGKHKNHLLLVIDDQKEDWWLRKHGHLLGPRPELRKEYWEETGFEVDFATSERFLDWAASVLHLERQPDFQRAVAELMRSRNKAQHEGQSRKPLHKIWSKDDSDSDNDEFEQTIAANEMAEWFLGHYEDPANSVPYESREGGYQYCCGGPYSAEEVLLEEFPDESETVIDCALSIIDEEGGPEWVLKEDY